MKIVLLLLSFLLTLQAQANLYLQTEYQEGKKGKIITKHHIFLNQRYPINYSNRGYVLLLTKVNGNRVTIERESYSIDKFGHKTMIGGGLGEYMVGKSFLIKEPAYSLKIVLEKTVPSVP